MVLWKARNAAIRISSSVLISSTTSLYAHVTANQFETAAMNVEVKLPEGGTEEVPLLGEDSNGYQNEELDEMRKGKATVTFDLLEGNLNITAHIQDTTSTSGGAAGLTRYNHGDDTVSKRSIVLQLGDLTTVIPGTGEGVVNMLLNNARCVGAGTVKVDGKGHAIRSGIKFECLARDFWEEYDINN